MDETSQDVEQTAYPVLWRNCVNRATNRADVNEAGMPQSSKSTE